MSRSPHMRRQTLAVIPAALLMATTATLATPAHSAPQKEPTATLVTNVTFQILDHEDFGSNVHCTRNSQSRDTVRYLPRGFFYSGKCGGEIRVELDFRAALTSNSAVIIQSGHVKFFEGASENTDDQDGGLTFGYTGEPQTIIPAKESRTRTFYVENNDEGEPDDHATVTVTWTNIKNYQLRRIPTH
ncbi:hypothetical protein [Streptomyces vinaceus]|uniref:hypothetical protein n=1 Tax=Streptomyces vinaceus TaxID=1960 RepID=UPI0036B6C993